MMKDGNASRKSLNRYKGSAPPWMSIIRHDIDHPKYANMPIIMTGSILICAYPGARQRFTRVLADHQLAFADTLGEALAALESRAFDLILIGTRFDESRMFDLLRHLHAEKKSGETSIVCFRGMMSVPASDAAVVEGLSLACELLGARAFYDFANYPDDDAGNDAVRRIVASHLSPAEQQRHKAAPRQDR